jgi:hypothetical protein
MDENWIPMAMGWVVQLEASDNNWLFGCVATSIGNNMH